MIPVRKPNVSRSPLPVYAASLAAGMLWLSGCQIRRPPVTGLRGIYPPVVYDAAGGFGPNSAPAVKFVRIDSMRPTMKWETFPTQSDREVDKEDVLSRIQEITYDLRIWEVFNGRPAGLVYEREGLPSAEHRLEIRLLPRTQYCWSIRARFKLNGQIRVTPWSFSHWPWPPNYKAEYGSWSPARPEQIPPANYYRFETPSE
jgi:hypothetical protein